MDISATTAKAFYEAAFLSSPDGVLLIDPDTQRALLFNDAACRQLGYTREEFAELRIPDYEALETATEVRAHVQRVLDDRTSEFDTMHRTKSGEIAQVHVWSARVTLGDRTALYTIFRDVSEQRRVEAALQDSHELLDRTGRLARIGGWRLDLATQALDWTAEVFSIHEVDPATPPSVANAINFYAPEARPIIAAAVQSAIDQGTPFDLELPLVTARGRRIWVRAQGTAERRGGVTSHLHGAFQDITERKQTEELRRLQSAALYAAAEGIVITGLDGTIEWVNPAFTTITGYAADEARGRNSRDLVKSGHHPPEFYREMWQTILDGRTWQGLTFNRRKDGSQYTEEQAITPIRDGNGSITHFVAIKKDVTERRKLEEQLRQSQKMDTVGKLAAGVAHDFNNLLTVINGVAELVVANVAPTDPIRDDIREILDAGQRAAVLTRQLLAFSRQQILRPEVVDLNTVVALSESLLRRLLGENIEVIVVAAPDLHAVRADPGQMEQVITNLAVNARDAMPEGGKLRIETRNVEIDDTYANQGLVAVPPGSYVQLAVSDTGTGMDDATRARVFDPFFTTKDPGKGTGLGLSTVYGIVKQSNGFVFVYSELGHGTMFRVYLPRLADAREPVAPTREPGLATGTETILVVEDNAGLHKLVTRLLESGGYTVLAAATGEEALAALSGGASGVSLVLTDVVMPKMSGRQLVAELAASYPEIKVLYMSGYTDDTIVRHGVSDAGVPFLGKPFTKAELLKKVREALDG